MGAGIHAPGQGALSAATPTILLSLLRASAFCPPLMVSGLADAGLGLLTTVSGGS